MVNDSFRTYMLHFDKPEGSRLWTVIYIVLPIMTLLQSKEEQNDCYANKRSWVLNSQFLKRNHIWGVPVGDRSCQQSAGEVKDRKAAVDGVRVNKWGEGKASSQVVVGQFSALSSGIKLRSKSEIAWNDHKIAKVWIKFGVLTYQVT